MSDTATVARLTRLLAECGVERRALERLAGELDEHCVAAAQGHPMSRAELSLACVDLHGYYTALESLLERVARVVDRELPEGSRWHSELIVQMTLELPGVRPAVLPVGSLPELDELRRFRHFFRSVYVLDADPERVLAHAQRVVRLHPALTISLDGFETFARGVVSALTP